jgi:hypothetical protein
MRNGLSLIVGIVAFACVGATAVADAAVDPPTRLWLWKSRAMFAFADQHDRYLVPTGLTTIDADRRSVMRFRIAFTAVEKQTLKPATDGVLSARWTVGIPNLLNWLTDRSPLDWAAPGPSVCGYTNIPCRYVTMMASGFSDAKLLVPVSIAALDAYRSCPSQTTIQFKSLDLSYDRFLQRPRVGLISTRMIVPLSPFLSRQQLADCVQRRRMEPV